MSVGECVCMRNSQGLTCREGPPRNCFPSWSGSPTSPEPSQATSKDAPRCLPPAARRAQPEPAPAFTTMFKGLNKGTQGKGSPKGSPSKGSPKGSPSKHSR